MTLQLSSTFTGADGAAWPISAGGWNHASVGTFSPAPTENILTNRGRQTGTASAVGSARYHYANNVTALETYVTTKFNRASLDMWPGLIARSTSNSSTAPTCYACQIWTNSSGKSPTYDLRVLKCVAGTWTQLVTLSIGATSLNVDYNLELLVTSTPAGYALVQARCWLASGSQAVHAKVPSDSPGVAGTLLTATNAGAVCFVDNTATIYNTAGYVGTWNYWNTAVSLTMDWDDFYFYAVDKTTQTLTAESIGVTDTSSSMRTSFSVITDAIGITDSSTGTISGGSNFTYTQTDDIGVSDAQVIEQGTSRSLTDAVGLTDVQVVVQSASRPLTDTVGITDTRATTAAYVRSQTDNIGIVDVATSVVGVRKVLVDTVGLVDSRSAVVSVTRAITDPVGIIDSRTLIANVRTTISDSVGIVDLVSRSAFYYRVDTSVIGVIDDNTAIMNAIAGLSVVFGKLDNSWHTHELETSWVAGKPQGVWDYDG